MAKERVDAKYLTVICPRDFKQSRHSGIARWRQRKSPECMMLRDALIGSCAQIAHFAKLCGRPKADLDRSPDTPQCVPSDRAFAASVRLTSEKVS
jgi:hypothetical protein